MSKVADPKTAYNRPPTGNDLDRALAQFPSERSLDGEDGRSAENDSLDLFLSEAGRRRAEPPLAVELVKTPPLRSAPPVPASLVPAQRVPPPRRGSKSPSALRFVAAAAAMALIAIVIPMNWMPGDGPRPLARPEPSPLKPVASTGEAMPALPRQADERVLSPRSASPDERPSNGASSKNAISAAAFNGRARVDSETVVPSVSSAVALGGLASIEKAPAVPDPPPAASPASEPATPAREVSVSASSEVPPPSPPLSTEADADSVRTVLDRYRAAFNLLDANAAQVVWPSVDGRALRRAFDQLTEQELRFDACGIDVYDSQALASCSGTARFVPKVGNPNMHTARREWTFRLRQVDDMWLIEMVDAR